MKIIPISGGVCAVKGVRAYGLKEGSKGLALIEGEGKATGMFTVNKIKAAPVKFTKKQLESGRISAIIANSGCANSFTGEQGLKDAEKMAELASSALGLSIDKDSVAVASTGFIGLRLDMGLIERQLGEVVRGLTSGEEGSTEAAKAIMTTDTFHKEIAISIDIGTGTDRVVIGGIAKGSGMIFPHMSATATMLAFIYTDAYLEDEVLSRSLKAAVEKTFNMTVVDGDISTNDMVLLIATGKSADVKIGEADFTEGLSYVCQELAKQIARDGEGATKFIEVQVKGALSLEDRRSIARAIVRSPLVKSAIFGERPGLLCGRIIAAIGGSSITTPGRQGQGQGQGQGPDLSRISIKLRGKGKGKGRESERERENLGDKEFLAVKDGEFMDLFQSSLALEIMRSKEIFIVVNLGTAAETGATVETEAIAWGCDLSYDYIRINVG